MPSALDMSCPEVGGATGFEEDGGALAIVEEGLESGPRDAALLIDPFGLGGDRDLKGVLGKVDGDESRVHSGLLLWSFISTYDIGTLMPEMSGRSPSHHRSSRRPCSRGGLSCREWDTHLQLQRAGQRRS